MLCHVVDFLEVFQVSRVGEQHQAGSDSLLTSRTFFRMRDAYFPHGFDEDSFKYDFLQFFFLSQPCGWFC